MDPVSAVKTLAALTRADADASALGRALDAIPEAGWRNLVKNAAVHRVAPLVYTVLCAQGLANRAPEAARAALTREARGAGAVNMLLMSEHARVARAARAAGLRLLQLKGIHLINAGLYQPGERPMTDLDYATPRACSRQAEALLADLGFAREDQDQGAEFTERYAGEYHFLRMAGGVPVAVEVHFDLIPGPALRRAFPLDADRLAAHATDTESGPTPAPEHALLFSVLHFAVVHRFSRLIWVADVDRMCRSWELDWDFFEQEAQRAQAGTAVYAVLETARRLYGTDAPVQRFAAKAGAAGRMAANRAITWLAATAAHAEISAVPFAMAQHPLRTLARYVFPPADFMSLRYGVPRPLAPAYAVVRPLLLAIKSSRASNIRKKLS